MFTWLRLTWLLTFGYSPVQSSQMNFDKYGIENGKITEIITNSFYETFGIEATAYDRVVLRGSMTCFEKYGEVAYGAPNFYPWALDSKIGADFYLTDMNSPIKIYLSADHDCKHPLNVNGTQISKLNISSTTLSITVKGTLK